MDPNSLKTMAAAAGVSGTSAPYIDDVFSIDCYTGTGSARSVTNGVDLAGEGGLVWIKNRVTGSSDQTLMDTERGAGKQIHINTNGAAGTGRTDLLSSFNSNGFSIGGGDRYTNDTNDKYVAYSFRKQEKFFDIVTYTGTGVARTIAHNLGSVPGFIMVKKLNGAESWVAYHRGIGNNKTVYPDLAAQADAGNDTWNSTTPTATHFSVKTDGAVNGNGDTYVAYLFAHHDGDGNFGPDENKDAIKCGTYTGNGGDKKVTLGWEPQWLWIRNYDGYDASWILVDTMRGIGFNDANDIYLNTNTDGVEVTTQDRIELMGNGFRTTENDSDTDANTHKFMYIAIRKKDGVVGKPAEAGTDVFAMDTGDSSKYDSGFPVDFAFYRQYASTSDWWTVAKQLGKNEFKLNAGSALSSWAGATFDSNDSWGTSVQDSTNISWMFRCHQGFDVTCWRGTSSGNDKHHNLGRIPEMIWCKAVNTTSDWTVYHKDLNSGTNPHDYRVLLNSTAGESASDDWGGAGKTALVFDVSGEHNVNDSSHKYMALCFASVTGICKVGSYTGNGTSGSSTQEITTGFSPRIIIIKRVNSTSGWLMFDTLRGISNSGNDKRMELNDTAAQDDLEVIDTLSSTSFTVKGNYDNSNNDGHRYIYYAHA